MSKDKLVNIFWSGLGSFTGVSVIGGLATLVKVPLLVPSFGATAVLLFGACHQPMAQPRNVIGGHIISALAGVIIYKFLGNHWWSIAVGVTLAIVLMMLTDTLHPPGGATAFVTIFTNQGFDFVITPIALGVTIMTGVAYLTNNLTNSRCYPIKREIEKAKE